MSRVKFGILFAVAITFVVGLGIYFGNAIFGQRSFVVLKNLQKERAFLQSDIKRLKDENARLQKLYLERASLDPDFRK